MTINKQSRLENFIRGSDTLWHSIQMFFAGLQRLIVAGTIVCSLVFAALFVLGTNKLQREIIFKHYYAASAAALGLKVNVWIHLPDGDRKFSAVDAKFVTEKAVGNHVGFVFLTLVLSISAGVGVAVLLARYHVRRGQTEAEDKFLRGQQIVSEEHLEQMTSDSATLGFQIGSVGIPDNLLARNLAFLGGMGTGKSQAVFNFLDAARPSVKAVIYDVTGDFVERFYDPSRGDVILNPFDERCAPWSIFSDLRTEIDYTTVSQYFVHKSSSEANPIFVDAGRLLLEDVLKLVQLEPGLKRTMGEVAKIILTKPLDELAALVRKHGLPSSGSLNPDNPKTSESVRFTLASQIALRFFKLFDSLDAGFSVRNFIESDSKGWLFITSHPEQHAVIRPFAAAWLELALLAAMGGRPINRTRVIFSIDELASLPNLHALEIGMTQGRKFGVCTALGFQNEAQLEVIYGKEMARVLLSNAQTKVVFRTEDADSAKSLAETLGKQEIDEASEGMSFGIESSRDSSQISRRRAELSVVLPSEIQTLPDLTAFLKVAGNFPIARVCIPYKNREFIAEPYIFKTLNALPVVEEQPLASSVSDDDVSLRLF